MTRTPLGEISLYDISSRTSPSFTLSRFWVPVYDWLLVLCGLRRLLGLDNCYTCDVLGWLLRFWEPCTFRLYLPSFLRRLLFLERLEKITKLPSREKRVRWRVCKSTKVTEPWGRELH